MKFNIIAKAITIWALLVFQTGVSSVMAIPSYPNPTKVRQADGTTITVRLYGDERFNYATTIDDYQVVSHKGIYYYATINGNKLVSTGVKAKEPSLRGNADMQVLRQVHRGFPAGIADVAMNRAPSLTMAFGASNDEEQLAVYRNQMLETRSSGEQFKSLVILVNFTDKSFSIDDPTQAFDRMLNSKGYSENGATGSARDYYEDNSNGKFKPQFDVKGVYTMSKSVYYYSGHEEDFVVEACNLAAKGGVDFSQYVDNGILRDVFIFFAGYNNAEVGGGTFLHPARIFYTNPSYSFGTWGGGKLMAAAYTSELKGSSGTNMAGIGTFCHEFGHILGWPDFYDTNYTENGIGFNLDIFSLMASGGYVNNGRTPPAVNAYERYLAKWLDFIEIDTSGKYLLKPVYDGYNYIINTANSGEMFLFEYRNGSLQKWDRFLEDGNSNMDTGFPAVGRGSGMLVYHIDKSQNKVGNRRAIDMWGLNTNMVNAYGTHECMRFIMASNIKRSGGVLYNFGNMFFPGSSNVTKFTSTASPYFVGWDGYTPGLELYNIKEEPGVGVSFEVANVVPTVNNFTVNAGQDNVFASFLSPHNKNYKITCEEVGSTSIFTKTSKNQAANFNGLKSGVEYKVTLYYDNDDTVIETAIIRTESVNTNKTPSLIIKSRYATNEFIGFGYKNVPSEVKSVKWTVDGKAYDELAVKLTAKTDYRIMAEITTADGIEYLVKYVTVY